MHVPMRLSWLENSSQSNILTENIKKLNDNIQDLVTNLIHIKDSLQSLTQAMTIQNTSEQNLLLIKQQMEDMVYTSYDGILVWKIIDVAQKLGK